ncbi:MAG: hypothetical protein R3A11_07650 [Bdellovibrionota bacterium]
MKSMHFLWLFLFVVGLQPCFVQAQMSEQYELGYGIFLTIVPNQDDVPQAFSLDMEQGHCDLQGDPLFKECLEGPRSMMGPEYTYHCVSEDSSIFQKVVLGPIGEPGLSKDNRVCNNGYIRMSDKNSLNLSYEINEFRDLNLPKLFEWESLTMTRSKKLPTIFIRKNHKLLMEISTYVGSSKIPTSDLITIEKGQCSVGKGQMSTKKNSDSHQSPDHMTWVCAQASTNDLFNVHLLIPDPSETREHSIFVNQLHNCRDIQEENGVHRICDEQNIFHRTYDDYINE